MPSAPSLPGEAPGTHNSEEEMMDTTTQAPTTLTVTQPVDRAEAIRRGFGGAERQQVTLDLAPLTAEERTMVAARIRRHSYATGQPAGDVIASVRGNGFPLTLDEPTPAGLLAAVQADEAAIHREAAEREGKIAEAVERVLAASDEELLSNWSGYHGAPSMVWLMIFGEADYRELRGRVADRLAPLHAEWKRREEAKKAEQEGERAERERQKAEREQAAAEECAAWIREHGSVRLRRLLAEGIEHGAIYRDERIAADRPGWTWQRDVAGESSEPRNPPQGALDLLDEARQTAPDARLVYWTAELEAEEDDDYEDDEEGDRTVRGYTCTASFLGRDIVYRTPQDGTPPVLAS